MKIVEDGVTGKVTPLQLTMLSRSVLFYKMVDWYYRTTASMDIYYDEIDDRTGYVTITEPTENGNRIKSFTIGMSDKKEIERCYLFYHRGTRL